MRKCLQFQRPISCDVGECLSTTIAIEKKNNRACFLKLMSSIRFLAHQGLAIRRDGISEPGDSNFHQVVKLRAEDEPDGKLTEWVKKEK